MSLEDEYVYCRDCGLRRYLKDSDAWDRKTATRKWLQHNCPRGLTKGCSTRLSTAKEVREAQKRKMAMFAQQAYAARRAVKKKGTV